MANAGKTTSTSSGSGKFTTFDDLATHLQSSSSNHAFAMQGSSDVVLTSSRGRDDGKRLTLNDDRTHKPKEIAYARGFHDMATLADPKKVSDEDLAGQLHQMSQFVQAQRAEVAKAWGESAPRVFAGRAEALLAGADAKRFRTSASTLVGNEKVKGWDENIQTEIVHARIHGRQKALDALEANGNPRHATLVQMHALMAESSSLARSPTAVVGGSLDALEEASAAHPGPRKVNKGSVMGNSVGASPRAHVMRTGIMQAFEEQAGKAGANVAERQMARVLMARRATTNAFEAPPISGTTNSVFTGAKRSDIIGTGREIDKHIYSNLRQAAGKIGSKNFQRFVGVRTRSSSGVWPAIKPSK